MTGADRLRSFGRRRGRKLRKGRLELLNALLPGLRPAMPAPPSGPGPGGGVLRMEGLFKDPQKDIWLEVGFGGGEHLAKQARAHPDIGMIGCEPFVNGVAGLLARIQEQGLSNIRIFDDDARLLFDVLPDASIGRMFVLFADPWPKKRHHGRRFINTESLDELARIMKNGAVLRFASDHMGYVRWTLEHILRHPSFSWLAEGPGDWRRRADDWFETRYEKKALEQGRPCVFLQFQRAPR